MIERQRRWKNIKVWWFDIIRIFFQERILLILNFFFVLQINIVISFDVTTKTTTTKKRTKTIFTKTKRVRKIFRIGFSIETFKKKRKKTEKKHEKQDYKTVKKDIITIFKWILQKFIMLIWASEIETTSKNETFDSWFDIFKSTKSQQMSINTKNIKKFMMIFEKKSKKCFIDDNFSTFKQKIKIITSYFLI